MFHVLVAGLSIPAAEYVELLREVLEEVRPRSPRLPGAPRLLVWGSVIDHPKLYEIIEETGGHVVADDNCIGTRSCVNQVDPGASPLKALSRAYFADVQCPRTDRGPGTARFDYLLDMVRDYDVRGVVGYTYQFCDPHKLDYPDLRDLLKAKGVPMLLVDDDYSLGNGETIKNRVQAFLETLS
jgi:benzoyl-CoA reductase/2-hydroxyglutaryl-CoA dehydratase subunit BcrC/BadD/HgdB